MEMSATQKVGQEIKKVRYRMGMTQKELGKLIGKSESQIGAYACGGCGTYGRTGLLSSDFLSCLLEDRKKTV